MKIAIIGYGKMGRMIEKLATEAGDQIVLKITEDNVQELTAANLQKADVAIEFSRPEAAFENLSKCLHAGIPVVSGTTGWLHKKEAIEQLCQEKKGAFLYASNFSVGVNVFFALNQFLAKMMATQSQYQPTVEEIHHTQKLDAPSGTAITLAESIIQHLPNKSYWVNTLSEKEKELSIVSERTDDVPGTHAIRYGSTIDDIEIRHVAHSRAGFAQGALLAAAWIIGKEGSFSMKDVLGF